MSVSYANEEQRTKLKEPCRTPKTTWL